MIKINRFILKLIIIIFSVFPVYVHANTGLNNSLSGANNLSSDLVGWWTFDGKNVDQANYKVFDSSGKGNTGNINIDLSQGIIQGKNGQGIKFSDYPDSISTTNIVNIPKVTISAWVKIVSLPDINLLVTGFMNGLSSSTYDKDLYIDTSGKLRFYVNDGSGKTTSLPSNPIPLNTWVHVVGTADGSNAYAYVNGVQVGSVSAGNTYTSYTVPNIFMQGQTTTPLNSGGYGKISMDDVRVYSRALSSSEVIQLYNSTKGSVFNASFSTGITNSGLKAYWTFDGKDIINNVADISGNNNNGYLQYYDSTTTSLKQGKLGQSLFFDGNVNSAVLSSSPITSIGSPNSSCAWAKTSDLSISPSGWYQTIFNFYVNGNNALRMGSIVNSGNLFVAYMSGGVLKGSQSVSPVFSNNTWSHVCYVFDGNNVDLYANGNSIATTTNSDTPGSPSEIGARDDQGDGNWYGTLDDIRVYNKALTALEIKQIYNAGKEYKQNVSMPGGNDLSSGLLGWFTFDGPYLLKNVKDRSNQGNNGYISGFTSTSTAVIPGKMGQAIKFDGVDDKISTLSDFIGTSAITVSVWIKPELLNSTQRILSNGKTELTIEPSLNRGAFKIDIAGVAFSANNSLTLNKWIHIVATRTSGGITNIYINGSLSGTVDQALGTPVSGTTNVIIGNVSDGSSGFKGSMDDMRIYNRVLSASQILQLYNMGR